MKKKLREKLRKKFLKICSFLFDTLEILLIVSFLIVSFLIGFDIGKNKTMRKMQNKLMCYKYLSNYHCWSANFKTTFYTLDPKECSKDKTSSMFGITRMGIRAIPDFTVAVDPKVVKLGSILIDVQTGKIYLAMDTGNLVKGYHVDIFKGEGTEENRKAANSCLNKTFIVIEPLKIF
jgi:3D (Asp-Asp-Asp) domain-containing protein